LLILLSVRVEFDFIRVELRLISWTRFIRFFRL